MFADPLMALAEKIDIPATWFWIALSAGAVMFSHFLVYATTGPDSSEWKNLRADVVENFIWPFFMFGGTAAAALFIWDLDKKFFANVQSLGIQFEPWELFNQGNISVFIISSIIALAISINSAFRFKRHNEPEWIVGSNWVLWAITIFRSTPMGIWIIPMLFRIVNHFYFYFQFGKSSWLPEYLYFSDGAFGLDWLRETIQIELFLIFILSLMPLAMIIQISKLDKKLNQYTLLSITGLAIILLFVLPVVLSVDEKLEAINTHWGQSTIEELEALNKISETQDLEEIAKTRALEQRLSNISQMPRGLGNSSFYQLAITVAGGFASSGFGVAQAFGINPLNTITSPIKGKRGNSRKGRKKGK
jgi:hypothetical protein